MKGAQQMSEDKRWPTRRFEIVVWVVAAIAILLVIGFYLGGHT
jgi:type VI protein secretion system component VasF